MNHLSGLTNSNKDNNQPAGAPAASNTAAGPAPGAEQKDYLDKGLDAAEHKYGGQWGANPDQHRKVNEQITDGIRGAFEKVSGKKVPDKISN